MNLKKNTLIFQKVPASTIIDNNIELDYEEEDYHSNIDERTTKMTLKPVEPLKNQFNQQEYSASCGELLTIEETDDDELQYNCFVEKQSRTGILFNKRVISIDSEYFSYYSPTQLNSSNRRINRDTKPKAKVLVKDISDIIIPADKPNTLRISGKGIVQKKNKSKRSSENKSFSFVFRFKDTQVPVFWRNLVNGAKEALKNKQYLYTFENLIPNKRCLSSS